jgi:hypothetical protein
MPESDVHLKFIEKKISTCSTGFGSMNYDVVGFECSTPFIQTWILKLK